MLVDALKFGTFGLFSAMGGWVLYTDLRFQKIRNRVLLAGLAAALAAYLIALTATFLATVGAPMLGGTYYTWGFYRALACHAVLAAAAALALWNLKIWPAGDAKLFALFSLLLPLAAADIPGFPAWLFMTCLINVFLPPAFFILGRALWWAARQSVRVLDGAWRADAAERVRARLAEWRADPAQPRALLRQVAVHQAFYVSYYLVIFALRGALPQNAMWLSPLLGLVLMYGVGTLQHRLQRGVETLLPVFIAGASWVLWRYGAHAALVAVGRGLQFALTVGLAAELSYAYLSRDETREVKIDDLQVYQVLAPATLELLRSDIVFLGENFNLTYKDGIQPSQLEPLKEWLRKRQAETAVIFRTTPFAPWIVLGFCLTLLLRTDIAWMMSPNSLFSQAGR